MCQELCKYFAYSVINLQNKLSGRYDLHLAEIETEAQRVKYFALVMELVKGGAGTPAED